ncbi:MAG: helix-turn-helix transcriptional regulator [Dermatophilaceae bacterium]
MAPALVADLGGYLREQRMAARLSLRQLSELAGISNPYLSQIERGLKRPSAQILQQLAHGLQMSAESLYIKAGILQEGSDRAATPGVLDAIAADPQLTPRQRGVLVEVYRAFVSRELERGQDHAPLAAAEPTLEPQPPTAASGPTQQSQPDGTRASARSTPPPRLTPTKETPWQAQLPRSATT